VKLTGSLYYSNLAIKRRRKYNRAEIEVVKQAVEGRGSVQLAVDDD
jgi:hypothetical protein